MPKLVNGAIDTPTMLRLLAKHPTWTASAPKEGDWPSALISMKASVSITGASISIVGRYDSGPAFVVIIPLRSDWTIHRPPAERKKRERVCLGLFSHFSPNVGGREVEVSSDGTSFEKLPGLGTWTIYAEREP